MSEEPDRTPKSRQGEAWRVRNARQSMRLRQNVARAGEANAERAAEARGDVRQRMIDLWGEDWVHDVESRGKRRRW